MGRAPRKTSLMSLFLRLQKFPTYLVRLIWMVLEIRGRWPYNCCFVGCCFQDLFNMTRSILVQFPSKFFYIRLVSVHVVHPYSRLDTTAVWRKLLFISSDRFDFHMINNLSIAVHTFASRILISFSVDETLNLSTRFREPLFSVEMFLFRLKHMYSVHKEANANCSRPWNIYMLKFQTSVHHYVCCILTSIYIYIHIES